MAEDLQNQSAKLIVTSRGLEPSRHFRFALRSAIPGARVRGTGFRGIVMLEAKGDPAEIAKLLWSGCAETIGHVTAVFTTVESSEPSIRDAAIRVGVAHIEPDESYCFRLHKRGAHELEKDTSTLEPEIGAAIWTAFETKHQKKPKVSLSNPDITVVAEVLGPMTAMGISRKAWRE